MHLIQRQTRNHKTMKTHPSPHPPLPTPWGQSHNCSPCTPPSMRYFISKAQELKFIKFWIWKTMDPVEAFILWHHTIFLTHCFLLTPDHSAVSIPIFPCPIGLRMFSLASVKPSLQYRYQTPFSHQIMKWINIMKLFPTSVSQLLFHLWRRACIFKTLIIFSQAFGLIENVTDPWKLCLLSKPWFH